MEQKRCIKLTRIFEIRVKKQVISYNRLMHERPIRMIDVTKRTTKGLVAFDWWLIFCQFSMVQKFESAIGNMKIDPV